MPVAPLLLGAVGLASAMMFLGGKKKKTPGSTTALPGGEESILTEPRPGSGGVDTGPKEPPATGGSVQGDWEAWIQSKVTNAVQSGSVSVLEATAKELEKKCPKLSGDTRTRCQQAAVALRSMAASLRADALAREHTDTPQTSVLPGIALPPPPPPPPPEPLPPPPTPVAVDIPDESLERAAREAAEELERRTEAAQVLADYLNSTSRYHEDRNKVTAYQLQEGLTPDGGYGVGTGLSMLKYGVVPAKPYYFSPDKAKTKEAKALWTKTLLDQARIDPDRADEWIAASDVRYL